MSDSLLSAVRVVLYEPQDPVNIGATVRAMKNMGVDDLWLVRPCEYDANLIQRIAHDTHDIAARIRHVDTLEEALGDCVRIAAMTGKRRAAKWTLLDPRTAASDLLEHAVDGPVALLLGREDHGLPKEVLDRAHVAVTIPTTDHASLNLAQALVIMLYELHLRAGDASRRLAPPRKKAPPPTSEKMERYFGEAEQALAALDYFRTRNPELIMRSWRSLVFRASPDARELEMLRTMSFEIMRTVERVGRLSFEQGRQSALGDSPDDGETQVASDAAGQEP
jgi:TrmH family RNA methyltransferase